jgi:hypothetical protein
MRPDNNDPCAAGALSVQFDCCARVESHPNDPGSLVWSDRRDHKSRPDDEDVGLTAVDYFEADINPMRSGIVVNDGVVARVGGAGICEIRGPKNKSHAGVIRLQPCTSDEHQARENCANRGMLHETTFPKEHHPACGLCSSSKFHATARRNSTCDFNGGARRRFSRCRFSPFPSSPRKRAALPRHRRPWPPSRFAA